MQIVAILGAKKPFRQVVVDTQAALDFATAKQNAAFERCTEHLPSSEIVSRNPLELQIQKHSRLPKG